MIAMAILALIFAGILLLSSLFYALVEWPLMHSDAKFYAFSIVFVQIFLIIYVSLSIPRL